MFTEYSPCLFIYLFFKYGLYASISSLEYDTWDTIPWSKCQPKWGNCLDPALVLSCYLWQKSPFSSQLSGQGYRTFRQGLPIYPKLASNLLCSLGYPPTQGDLPAFWVLGSRHEPPDLVYIWPCFFSLIFSFSGVHLCVCVGVCAHACGCQGQAWVSFFKRHPSSFWNQGLSLGSEAHE